MQAEDVRALRRSAVPTAALGVLAILVAGLVHGGKAALGATLALALVLAFFSISHVVVSRTAKGNPSVMMGAAVGTYTVKIVILAVLVSMFKNTTAFSGRVFGLTAVALVLVWSGTQVYTMTKTKQMLYVEPRP